MLRNPSLAYRLCFSVFLLKPFSLITKSSPHCNSKRIKENLEKEFSTALLSHHEVFVHCHFSPLNSTHQPLYSVLRITPENTSPFLHLRWSNLNISIILLLTSLLRWTDDISLGMTTETKEVMFFWGQGKSSVHKVFCQHGDQSWILRSYAQKTQSLAIVAHTCNPSSG